MKLKVILTGSTGMVGKGVLLECLDHPAVDSVLVINRRPLDIGHHKLTEIIHEDFFNFAPLENALTGYDACFFCLGVSALGMSEEKYTQFTFDLTVNFAETVLRRNPEMQFIYVSGQGTDNTGKSRQMWARVKGKTENTLLKMSFRNAWIFRPGFIQPMRGIKSSTKLYNLIYALFKPLYPVLKALFPKQITSTVQVGKAMIRVVLDGSDKTHFYNHDINVLAAKDKLITTAI